VKTRLRRLPPSDVNVLDRGGRVGNVERQKRVPMRLRYSNASPFVRKVLVFAHETGLAQNIELVLTDVWAADTDIARDNPLGKVPTLVTADGAFIGSALCCEYLDSLHAGPPLIPRQSPARWQVLQRHALADGIIEAAVAHVVETLRRPAALVYSGTLERQQEKIQRALDVIEHDVPAYGTIDLASVTLGCALGYLDFRHGDLRWRTDRPKLTVWYSQFETRTSMIATVPKLPGSSPAHQDAPLP
jgi:glutathione S-transferase